MMNIQIMDNHALSSFLSNPPRRFMYCLFSLLSLLFLKMASHALLLWFLFLEVAAEVNPIIFFISYSASSTSYPTYSCYFFYSSFLSTFGTSSFDDFYSSFPFFLSRDRDLDWCSSLDESSLISCNLASRALRSTCLLDSLIFINIIMMRIN